MESKLVEQLETLAIDSAQAIPQTEIEAPQLTRISLARSLSTPAPGLETQVYDHFDSSDDDEISDDSEEDIVPVNPEAKQQLESEAADSESEDDETESEEDDGEKRDSDSDTESEKSDSESETEAAAEMQPERSKSAPLSESGTEAAAFQQPERSESVPLPESDDLAELLHMDGAEKYRDFLNAISVTLGTLVDNAIDDMTLLIEMLGFYLLIRTRFPDKVDKLRWLDPTKIWEVSQVGSVILAFLQQVSQEETVSRELLLAIGILAEKVVLASERFEGNQLAKKESYYPV